MAETFIKTFTHVKDMPKADRALPMLKRVASLVKPIMRKHGWILPTLSEFFPDSPNLLGKFTPFPISGLMLHILMGVPRHGRVE